MDALTMIATTKSALLRNSVHNLLVEEALTLDLSVFPALQNLWAIRFRVPAFLSIQLAPLRHLYCDVDYLEDFVVSGSFNPSAFSNVTHLELFFGPREDDTWMALTAFPRLTHLALNELAYIPHCPPLLDTSKSLRAFIILDVPPDRYRQDLEVLSEDPRFVMMRLLPYIEDWQHGILTGEDYWTRADTFIAKRISGEIPREWRANCSQKALTSSFSAHFFHGGGNGLEH
jgi:hypothetical protein